MLQKNKLKNNQVIISEIRNLTPSTFVLQLQRKNFNFKAGQHIGIGFVNDVHMRDYSIYSGTNEKHIEILIKEVTDGNLTPKFKRCVVGDSLRIDGPHGSFLLPEDIENKKFVFIATGTGISPFHSFVKSYPNLNYKIIHGVQFGRERYEIEHYNSKKYTLCTSQDINGDFGGRVTDYLRESKIDTDAIYYLCGNGRMIYEANEILIEKGVSENQIFYEVYF